MQHVAPNNVAICCVQMLRSFGQSASLQRNAGSTMLRYVVLKCCDRLAGACKRWANNVEKCCVEVLRSFGRGLRALNMTSKASAKRSQHVNAIYRNIVWRNMLRAFGHPIAKCCDMLRLVGSSLKTVKFDPTTPFMLQHVVTGWSNMLRPTILPYLTLPCCDRLAGAS